MNHLHTRDVFMRQKRQRGSSSSVRHSIMEEEYYSTIAALLLMDCVKQMKMFIQHGDTSTYTHCLAVSYYSYRVCRHLPIHVDLISVTRGALLHDLYLYDWHIPDKSHRLHGFYHPGIAWRNADLYFKLNEREEDIIKKHMWPLTLTRVPRYKEALIVCFVDKICSLCETLGMHYKKQFVFERINE